VDEFQIEAFLYVVKTKNFSRAAEMLHVTQSTITSRVKALESRFGKPLLHRTTRHVELTGFGMKIFPHLAKISETIKESVRLAHVTDQYDNSFSIGMIESAGHLPIVRALDMIQESFPKTSVYLMTAHSIDVAQAVIEGTIDLGVVYSVPKHPSLVMRKIHTDEIVLVGNSSHASSTHVLSKIRVNPQDLVRIDWSEHFAKWFREEFGPDYVSGTEVANANLALQIILRSKRIGFFPKSIVRPFIDDNSLKVLSYNALQPIPYRIIYAIFQKSAKQKDLITNFSNRLRSLTANNS
jgi:DNA-binding transcriptional LysR family regulator